LLFKSLKCDVYTNTIEGAFGNLKTGMRGVYAAAGQRPEV